jgi:hypothetical protein
MTPVAGYAPTPCVEAGPLGSGPERTWTTSGFDGQSWNTGGAPGINGDLRIYPKSGYVVAALTNIDPPAAQRISDYLDARLPTAR